MVPIQSWQHDAVTTSILTSGTLVLVVVIEFTPDRILAKFLEPWALWTIRIVLGVAFIVPMSAAILSDAARFVLRTFRDLRSAWSDDE